MQSVSSRSRLRHGPKAHPAHDTPSNFGSNGHGSQSRNAACTTCAFRFPTLPRDISQPYSRCQTVFAFRLCERTAEADPECAAIRRRPLGIHWRACVCDAGHGLVLPLQQRPSANRDRRGDFGEFIKRVAAGTGSAYPRDVPFFPHRLPGDPSAVGGITTAERGPKPQTAARDRRAVSRISLYLCVCACAAARCTRVRKEVGVGAGRENATRTLPSLATASPQRQPLQRSAGGLLEAQ